MMVADSRLPLKKRKSSLVSPALFASQLHLLAQIQQSHLLAQIQHESQHHRQQQHQQQQPMTNSQIADYHQIASCMSQCLDLRTSNSSISSTSTSSSSATATVAATTATSGQSSSHHQLQQASEKQPPLNSNDDSGDSSQARICMICEDEATGLHYGIITCEGCKGFFKRTVQNKRVYTCVTQNSCSITKQQRNRCQSCRFQKCLRQGMVLAAVREDRMPGGRNSGAVYNLYKVKYKKHKKTAGSRSPSSGPSSSSSTPTTSTASSPASSVSSSASSGSGATILKSALTSPLLNLANKIIVATTD